MKRLYVLLLVICSLEVYPQVQGKDTQSNVNDLGGGEAMFRSFDNRFKGIEGYPTLFKSYYPGQIIMISKVTVNYDSINLDIYSNDLLVKRKDLEATVLKGLVAGFSIKSPTKEMNFVKLKDTKGEDLYYEILVKGKVTLYKRVVKTISGPTKRDAYSVGRTYSIFEETVKLYIQQDDRKLVEIKNKKALFSEFPDKEEAISKFMKENRLDVKEEGGMIKVIEFINSLQ